MPGPLSKMNSDRPIVFLVPGDPGQRTGGYSYVRRIVEGLTAQGLTVRLQGLAGSFPDTDAEARGAIDRALDAVENDAVVVIDGLALSGLPPLAERHRARLVLLALVHHPLADETGLSVAQSRWYFASEKTALARVRGVIVTSDYTAARLADFDVVPSRIAVVPPGVDRPGPYDLAGESRADAALQILCVATLAPRKGQDLLVAALAQCRDLAWQCALAGSVDRHPEYVSALRAQIEQLGLDERIDLCGELDDNGIAQAYRQADLFVLPSWYEGYGMVITEAMAHGLPVITTTGGALAHTVNPAASLVVPPGDSDALAAALRQALEEPERRQLLAAGAEKVRAELPTWTDASATFGDAIMHLLNKRTEPPRG